METLAEYDFTLHHIPGPTNTVADSLSQCPDLKEGVQTVNDNITVLPETLFANKISLPVDLDARRQAVYKLHDTPSAGHPGMTNNRALVSQRYKDKGLKQFVEQYIKGCPTCQSNKNQ